MTKKPSDDGALYDLDLNQSFAEHWVLDKEISFLNHGSFGACPKVVLDAQRGYQDELEARPMAFLVDELEGRLDLSREALAKVIGAKSEDVVFVPNITHGVNTVLRSLTFKPGDELITTNYDYNACRMAMEFVAERWGAKVVVADVPFPIEDPQQVIDAVEKCVTKRSVFALIDHVTSPTATIFPVAPIVESLQSQGVDVLVDGAHVAGMLPLDIEKIGAAYYTGNCHKWLCTPKGCGFLHVREDRQEGIRPLCISHGANNPRTNRKKLLLEFDWPGTIDPTPYLALYDAIEFLEGLLPGGLNALMTRNREVAIASAEHLAERLDVKLPVPRKMLGSIVAVGLPNDLDMPDLPVTTSMWPIMKLQRKLYDDYRIQTVMSYFPKPPVRYLRVSAQAYNTLNEYERLGDALMQELE